MGCGFQKSSLRLAQRRDDSDMFALQKKFGTALQQWREHFSCSDRGCAVPGRIWNRASNRSSSARVHNANYCFPGCFEQELQRRFAKLDSISVAKPPRTHRMPLGLLMLSRGDIDSAQLRAVITRQREQSTSRIGECMQQMGFVGERQVTAALGAQWACPVLPENAATPARECPVPYAMLRAFRMAPVSYLAATRIMHVAFADGINYSALLAIEQALGCGTEACVCSSRELKILLDKLEEKPHRSDREFASGIPVTEMVRISSEYAGMLRAQEVRLAACDGIIWVRVEGRENSMNLLFPPLGENSDLAG